MSETPTDAVNVVLAGLLREVAALREKMVQFDAAGGRQLQLDGLSADPKPPPQTIPQRIECCEDPEQVAQWHASLGAWVPWLVTSYHLQERVPPCRSLAVLARRMAHSGHPVDAHQVPRRTRRRAWPDQLSLANCLQYRTP